MLTVSNLIAMKGIEGALAALRYSRGACLEDLTCLNGELPMLASVANPCVTLLAMNVLSRFCFRECSDSRDRLFGLLHLLEWPSECPGFKVDYNLDAFQLALYAMPFYRP
jgi:hypothetical protein